MSFKNVNNLVLNFPDSYLYSSEGMLSSPEALLFLSFFKIVSISSLSIS
jgi:hypothetical protein